VGERGASALIKSSKGLREPHSAGAEAALLPLRTPALLDEFRGDVLLPVSTKTALYSTPARPRLAGSPHSIQLTVARLTPSAPATSSWVPFASDRWTPRRAGAPAMPAKIGRGRKQNAPNWGRSVPFWAADQAAFCSVTCGRGSTLVPILIVRGFAASGTS
jgi:hypothetical protein